MPTKPSDSHIPICIKCHASETQLFVGMSLAAVKGEWVHIYYRVSISRAHKMYIIVKVIPLIITCAKSVDSGRAGSV